MSIAGIHLSKAAQSRPIDLDVDGRQWLWIMTVYVDANVQCDVAADFGHG